MKFISVYILLYVVHPSIYAVRHIFNKYIVSSVSIVPELRPLLEKRPLYTKS